MKGLLCCHLRKFALACVLADTPIYKKYMQMCGECHASISRIPEIENLGNRWSKMQIVVMTVKRVSVLVKNIL
eukprot:c6372_g1_i1 orf=58-276(-)